MYVCMEMNIGGRGTVQYRIGRESKEHERTGPEHPQQESAAFQLISSLIQKKVKGTWWRNVPLSVNFSYLIPSE